VRATIDLIICKLILGEKDFKLTITLSRNPWMLEFYLGNDLMELMSFHSNSSLLSFSWSSFFFKKRSFVAPHLHTARPTMVVYMHVSMCWCNNMLKMTTILEFVASEVLISIFLKNDQCCCHPSFLHRSILTRHHFAHWDRYFWLDSLFVRYMCPFANY
jgi:hypothetical protein